MTEPQTPPPLPEPEIFEVRRREHYEKLAQQAADDADEAQQT